MAQQGKSFKKRYNNSSNNAVFSAAWSGPPVPFKYLKRAEDFKPGEVRVTTPADPKKLKAYKAEVDRVKRLDPNISRRVFGENKEQREARILIETELYGSPDK